MQLRRAIAAAWDLEPVALLRGMIVVAVLFIASGEVVALIWRSVIAVCDLMGIEQIGRR